MSCDEIHNSFAYNKNVAKRQLLNIRTKFGIQINEIYKKEKKGQTVWWCNVNIERGARCELFIFK